MFNNSMFDELQEVKYFKEIIDFKDLIIQRNKLLKSLQKAEAYLEPKQASIMELFCKYT